MKTIEGWKSGIAVFVTILLLTTTAHGQSETPDISGVWDGNSGGTYQIDQDGSTFSILLQEQNLRGNGTIKGSTLLLRWDYMRQSEIRGEITEINHNNVAQRIQWSNGLVLIHKKDNTSKLLQKQSNQFKRQVEPDRNRFFSTDKELLPNAQINKLLPKVTDDVPVLGANVPSKGIHVYDNNNQYLGIFAGFHSQGYGYLGYEYVLIFIPELNKFTLVSRYDGTIYNPDIVNGPYYESNDCTGQALYGGYWMLYYNFILRRSDNVHADYSDYCAYYPDYPLYYTLEVVNTIVNSRCHPEGDCREMPDGNGEGTWCKIVEIPEQAFPFSFPISVPLKYVYK